MSAEVRIPRPAGEHFVSVMERGTLDLKLSAAGGRGSVVDVRVSAGRNSGVHGGRS